MEHVVLVNEENEVLGTMPKHVVHGAETPLHRGFSLFVFDREGRLLLQQRSRLKTTWPLTWSNSCCGHPELGESDADASRRRAEVELGLQLADVRLMLPYRYRFTRDGVVENEICPILVARAASSISPNPEEVAETRWIGWPAFIEALKTTPGRFSPWCEEEALMLAADLTFRKWFDSLFDEVPA